MYKWKDVDPVQIVPGLHLPRFTLEQYKSAYCNVITNTGQLVINTLLHIIAMLAVSISKSSNQSVFYPSNPPHSAGLVRTKLADSAN